MKCGWWSNARFILYLSGDDRDTMDMWVKMQVTVIMTRGMCWVKCMTWSDEEKDDMRETVV